MTKKIVVECDASGYRLGAILMQDGHPVAYLSQGLKGRALIMPTYEKEIMAILLVIKSGGNIC